MKYKAIIFDLYGTLVPIFSRKVYDPVLVKMANILNVPYQEFWKIKTETINDRSLGFHSAEDHIKDLGLRLNVSVNKIQIEEILAISNKFTRNSLIPDPEVLQALNQLKSKGFFLGLITNCNKSVPMEYPNSPLAKYIDIPVFSCEEHIKKPSTLIYEIACDRLNIKPKECVYVGDGSSKELTGAYAVGMLPILKRTDLSDAYDPHRSDVENWYGTTIDEISQLSNMLPDFVVP
ncbi:HAD family hydrolase [Candidatus Poribacteria bacterium]|nr:HAD family hydrolase [Candidatus Poribacteria bacterium]